MDSKANALDWFEISVADMNRAKKFYQGLTGGEMPEENVGGVQMAYFPTEMGSGKLGGALAHSPQHKPHADGNKIYLNGNPDLSGMLNKVEGLGGKVLMPKTSIGNYGFMALFADTEGNVIGLHSGK